MNFIFLLIILGIVSFAMFAVSSGEVAASQQKVALKSIENPIHYNEISAKSIGGETSNLIYISSQKFDAIDKSRFLPTSMVADNSGNNTNSTNSTISDNQLKNSLLQSDNKYSNIRCNPLNYDPPICHLGPTIP